MKNKMLVNLYRSIQANIRQCKIHCALCNQKEESDAKSALQLYREALPLIEAEIWNSMEKENQNETLSCHQ